MKAIYSAGDNTLVINSHYISWGGSLDGPITAPTKTYLCDPSCKDVGWKDGQVLEEGKDFKLITRYKAKTHEIVKIYAVPIKPSTPSTEDQDELWKELVTKFDYMRQYGYTIHDEIMAELKQKYTITRNNANH